VSLSEDVRAELAAIEPRKTCCRNAELSALARTAGTLHLLGSGRVALHLDLNGAAVARRAFALVRSFGTGAEIRAYRRTALGHETRFQVHLADDPRTLQVLNEAGVVDARLAPLAEPPQRVVGRSCCRAAYLRGAMLAAGSISGPRSPHLELRTATREGADFLASLADEEGIGLRVVERKTHAAAYAKGGETIADFLGFVGAHDAALGIGESAVVGATRASANRLANADHANLVRTTRAAQGQIAAIERLRRRHELDNLPRELREVALLRLRHPALSLRELGTRCRPPTSKASVHRRLRTLERLAGP
jgi:cell division protein WhiA